MIAFLGPNEAGKTTVLRALDWYSNGEGALPSINHSSSRPPAADEAVVDITYWLDNDDLRALDGLGLVGLPEFYQRSRLADGSYSSELRPTPGRRDPASFVSGLRLFRDALEHEPPVDPDESEPNLAHSDEVVTQALSDPDGSWSEDWDVAYQSALDRLEATAHDEAAAALSRVRDLLQADHPDVAARKILRARAPRFLVFTEEDRELRSSYNLADGALRDDPPKGLENLAWVADLDLEALWTAIQDANLRKVATAERRANERLDERLSTRWSQRDLDVMFNVSGSELQVQIYEDTAEGAVTPVEERSDGLKTFIALVAFLARHDFDVPPVLLVDEAETHLHYDAQADLVEVLTKDVDATQVFYTTHSPGCLPRDLGTGVRLVAPVDGKSDESELRNDFWNSGEPGFTPLLFAMGAGAAAFSAFRKAVLTEGASDMILLPSLLRLATKKDDLDFQVAPGIANYHGTGLELEEVAARVAYLVDGDAGGDAHKVRLMGMGIPEDRIFQFERPTATEDYVDEHRYLGLLNDLLRVTGHEQKIQSGELDRSVSIGKAVEMWCDTRGIPVPSKTVVAAQLIDDPSTLRLADDAKTSLVNLHAQLQRALNARPAKGRR